MAAATETNVLDPEVVASMLARVRRDDSIERLKLRRPEVLALMAEGRANQAIAKQPTLTLGSQLPGIDIGTGRTTF